MTHLIVSEAPHIHGKLTTRGVMLNVLIALMPAVVAVTVINGLRALLVVAVSVACCAAFEYICCIIFKRKSAALDLSACVTGVILALTLPATIPLWQVAGGAFAAIVIAKQAFGGIGKNALNPAAMARLLMGLIFSGSFKFYALDGISRVTTLGLLLGVYTNTIIGVYATALLLGAAFLVVRRIITWEAPVFFTAAATLAAFALGNASVSTVLSGGILLAACFMATDTVTSPLTFWGRVIYAALGGAAAVLLKRFYGNGDDGIYLAILLINIASPLLDYLTHPRALGAPSRR